MAATSLTPCPNPVVISLAIESTSVGGCCEKDAACANSGDEFKIPIGAGPPVGGGTTPPLENILRPATIDCMGLRRLIILENLTDYL